MMQHSYTPLVSDWDTPATAPHHPPCAACTGQGNHIWISSSSCSMWGWTSWHEDSRLQAVAVGRESSSSCSRVCLALQSSQNHRALGASPPPPLCLANALSLSISTESLYQVRTSSKPSFISQTSTPASVKPCFPTKKDSVRNPHLNQMFIQALSMAGPSFPSPGAPGDFQPQGCLSVLVCS